MVHRQVLPVDVLHIHIERLSFSLITAAMKEIFQLHCIGVVEDPFVAKVELECLICEATLLNSVLQLADVRPELSRDEWHLRGVEESLRRQLRPILEGLLVSRWALVHGKLGSAGTIFVWKVVLVSDHVREEFHRCDGVRT